MHEYMYSTLLCYSCNRVCWRGSAGFKVGMGCVGVGRCVRELGLTHTTEKQ